MKATRLSFGEALIELGAANPQVVVLDADLSKSTQSHLFAKNFPDRFFQMGIQEANMIGVSAGMSFSGKIPFLCSFGAFLTGRFDTIRVTVAFSQANVRLVGTHAGIAIGEDGTSQMALEDMACMRSLPNMSILSPADDTETKALMPYLLEHKGPVYLRLTRQKVPSLFSPENYQFEMGKGVVLREGRDAMVFATGHSTSLSLEAAQSLAPDLSVGVVNIHTIKPLDEECVRRWAEQVDLILTVEDHNIIGGLGSAVAEVVAAGPSQVQCLRHGVPDVFGESGTPDALYKKYRLDKEGIAAILRQELC